MNYYHRNVESRHIKFVTC